MKNLIIILLFSIVGLPVCADNNQDDSDIKWLLRVPPIGYNHMLIRNGLGKESRTYTHRKEQVVKMKEDWKKLKDKISK
jgi:hypothetical protein